MTQAIINGDKVGNFKTININLSFRAWLGHDNKYFDRVCSNPECKGMYDSRITPVCPKCQSPLTFMRTGDGRPMGVSEGTFYPVLTQKQKERDSQRAMMRKGGTEKVYRFKMYSFGQGNVIAPPPEHAFCKKGALVRINIINHQSDSSIFITKEQIPKVEEMYHIFDNYGDSVTLIHEKAADESRIEYAVDASGKAVVDPIFAHAAGVKTTPQPNNVKVPADVESLKAQLNSIMTALNQIEAGGGGTPTETGAASVSDEPNPFASAT